METGGSKYFMRPEDKLEGSGDGGVWMKTGIFQSNAGLTRCIENLIALVCMSPVGQSEAKAPHLELQMGTANPLFESFLLLPSLYMHKYLWCAQALETSFTATVKPSRAKSILTNEQSLPASMNLVRSINAKGSNTLYLLCPHRSRKLRINKYCQNLSA